MSEQEAAVLNAAVERVPTVTLRGTVKWISAWTGGLIVLAWIAHGLVSLEPPAIVGGLLGGVSLVAGILCVYAIIALINGYVRWSRTEREFRRDELPEIRAALRDATVWATAVRAAAVVIIAESEDEGAGFVFDVGNGRLLFLKGQRYRPAEETMAWPNSEFEIVRSTVGGRWIGIFCSGAPLNAMRVLQSAECRDHIIWAEHEEVVDSTMDEFIRAIRKAA